MAWATSWLHIEHKAHLRYSTDNVEGMLTWSHIPVLISNNTMLSNKRFVTFLKWVIYTKWKRNTWIYVSKNYFDIYPWIYIPKKAYIFKNTNVYEPVSSLHTSHSANKQHMCKQAYTSNCYKMCKKVHVKIMYGILQNIHSPMVPCWISDQKKDE